MKRGSQDPRFTIAPAPVGLTVDDGRDCVAFAAAYRLALDPWQALTCETWMRRDRRGRWCAGTWGITVPRQNGKNGILEAVELYGMVVLGLRFLHTAHEVKTARKAFLRLLGFFDNPRDFPDLAARVAEIRRTNGQEAILLHNGASIEFVARSKGSGRGFTVDVLALDEAQDLREEELEALKPTISAAPSGDPVTIFMGTPPTDDALREGGKGEPFARTRATALGVKPKRIAWVEFSLDVDLVKLSDEQIAAIAADRKGWYRTNPALGRRINVQTIEDELTAFSPRAFCKERLNIWPAPQSSKATLALSSDLWRDLALTVVPSSWPLAAVGLDMDASGRLWTAVAAHAPAPGVHVEVLPNDIMAAGSEAAVRWLVQRCRRRPVVIPADSGADVLRAPLLAKGIKVYALNAAEQSAASASLAQAIRDGEVTHLADPVLDEQVRSAPREDTKTGWRVGRAGESLSAPLLAVMCARFGAVRWSPRKSHSGSAMRGGRGVT